MATMGKNELTVTRRVQKSQTSSGSEVTAQLMAQLGHIWQKWQNDNSYYFLGPEVIAFS